MNGPIPERGKEVLERLLDWYGPVNLLSEISGMCHEKGIDRVSEALDSLIIGAILSTSQFRGGSMNIYSVTGRNKYDDYSKLNAMVVAEDPASAIEKFTRWAEQEVVITRIELEHSEARVIV